MSVCLDNIFACINIFEQAGIKLEESHFVYSIYTLKGQPFLNKPNITNVISESRFIMYIDRSDNTIHFLAYTGKEPEEPIPLYFYSFYKDNITHPCLEYKIGSSRTSITLKIYVGSDYNKGFETHNISTSRWYY